jgi:hypothetical protein
MIGLEFEELLLEVHRGLNVGQDHRVEVHRVLVAPDLQDVVLASAHLSKIYSIEPSALERLSLLSETSVEKQFKRKIK